MLLSTNWKHLLESWSSDQETDSENSKRYHAFVLIFLVLRALQFPNSALCRGRGGKASLADDTHQVSGNMEN